VRRFDDAAPHLITALERHCALTPEACSSVGEVSGRLRRHAAGDPIEADGGRRRSFAVISGWAAEQRVLLDGRRQILRLRIADDICGLREEALEGAQLHALTDAVLADVTPLRDAVAGGRTDPSLIESWRRMERAEIASDLRHLVRLGRLTALERAGNLMVELFERLEVAGLNSGPVMPLPLTQTHLADHLGLSVVHVNRVLQQLRRDRYIEMRPRQVVIKDLASLARHSCYALGAYPPPPPSAKPSARGSDQRRQTSITARTTFWSRTGFCRQGGFARSFGMTSAS